MMNIGMLLLVDPYQVISFCLYLELQVIAAMLKNPVLIVTPLLSVDSSGERVKANLSLSVDHIKAKSGPHGKKQVRSKKRSEK